MIIYKITNKINQKCYIGQTIRDLSVRWNEHVANRGISTALSNAVKKYGKENFDVEVIFKAENLEELDKKEQEFIVFHASMYPNGYNLTSGGNRPTYSEITKLKISQGMSGEKHHNFGKKHSEATKLKMSIAKRGIPKSEEHKSKLGQSLKKPIVCVETGIIYESQTEAAKALGVTKSSVGNVLKGRLKSVKGFTFSYCEK